MHINLRRYKRESEQLTKLSKPIQGHWKAGGTMWAVYAVQHKVLKLLQVANLMAS
jgi:hypothetical protein